MFIRVPFFLAVVSIAALLAFPANVLGQNSSSLKEARNPTIDQRFRDKAIKDFETWRSSIPDYEKRLYDRVKALNARVVQTRGIAIVLVIMNGLLFYAFFRLKLELRRRNLKRDFVKISKAPMADAQWGTIDRMESRQRKLHRILTDIEGAFLNHKEYPLSKEQEIADLRDLVRDCREIYEQISDALGKGQGVGASSISDANQA